MRFHQHRPTEAQRSAVKRLVLEGISQVKIAASIGVAKSTLQRYYAEELKACDRPEGRPGWNPSNDDRETVTILICAGFKQDSIARRFGISVDTLQIHCSEEITNGYDLRRQDSVIALYRKGVGSDTRPNSAAIKEFLRKVDTLPEPMQSRRKEAVPGKKEQALADAQAGANGTSWAQLLGGDRPN
jgi:transposase